jgi:hypothetical protein
MKKVVAIAFFSAVCMASSGGACSSAFVPLKKIQNTPVSEEDRHPSLFDIGSIFSWRLTHKILGGMRLIATSCWCGCC